MGRIRIVAVGLALTCASTMAAVGALSVAPAAGATNELASVSTDGIQGNDISGRFAGPAISGNGRVIAFDSQATTLVPHDTNHRVDMFVHDRDTGETDRISVGPTGAEANGTSTRPAIDDDGNLIAYDSDASNLVAGDTNRLMDVFAFDRTTGTTQRVSVSSTGAQGNGSSDDPSVSADGRYVAFVSTSSNLVQGDTNHVEDIFVRDLVAGTTERVSLNSAGQQGNSSTTITAISPDGNWVAFGSFATNLVPGDTNGQFDVFLHDRTTGQTQLVSVASDGTQGDATSFGPAVSGDGQFVVFWSDATNLVPGDTNDRRDVFVRDVAAGTTERVSVNSNGEQANGTNEEPGVRGFLGSSPEITPDGRYVAFFSSATNLVQGDENKCPPIFDQEAGRCPDVFVRDRTLGTTTRVNVTADGQEANAESADPSISQDGQVVAFFSAAGNLVPGDSNVCFGFGGFPGNCPDIIVHDDRSAVAAPADLSLRMKDSPDPVQVGAQLTYKIRVDNSGPSLALSTTITDHLPSSVQIVSVTASQGGCDVALTTVCHVGTVPAGTSVLIRIVVLATQAGTIQNQASVTSTSPDPTGNTSAVVETTVTS
ncbi:MAG TPA: hypothetical protein VGH10_06630 [Actinomycetota bacterium]